jgi:hypothetical protein
MITNDKKAKICYEMAITDAKLTEGCNEYLQLLGILVFINDVIK